MSTRSFVTLRAFKARGLFRWGLVLVGVGFFGLWFLF